MFYFAFANEQIKEHAMSRSRYQKDKNAEWKFPVRIRIVIPELGFWQMNYKMEEWLAKRYGRDGFARTSGRMPGINDSGFFYFPDIEGALAFMQAFPDLQYAALPDFKLHG